MKIAILGGGVAGVSSAIALTRQGFSVSVYERFHAPSNIGAGLVLWPNAMYVLEQLGVADRIAAVSGKPLSMRRLSSGNEDLGAIDIGIINRQMGRDSYSILRADFQNILLAKLESLGIPIQYAHAVTNITTGESGRAAVQFENGSTITADVVIGADGRMASQARRYVLGENAPIYQGFINWIGVYESEADAFDRIEISDYWGVGERFGIVPVTSRKGYWAGGVASPGIGPRDPAQYLNELASIFAEWPEPVQKMIRGTPAQRINKIYVHDHDPTPVWHKHNLIAIGDAAHAPLPTSGQGACQALEDAWHLANCLVEAPRNLEQAFMKFTALRSEKTGSITTAARQLAFSLFNRDPTYCLARNENSRRANYRDMAVAMSRFWGGHLPLNAL